MTGPTDDPTTLASAYLDSEATPDERARVESDADLLAEVEHLRRVRALVADVDPAPISVRERHLAGALDAFDRLAADRPVDATPVERIAAPASFSSRRTGGASRWLLGAAASLVVVAAGAAVFRAVDDDGGDDLADTAEIAESGGDDAAVADPADAIPEMAAEEFTGERDEAPLPLPEGAEAESDGLATNDAATGEIAAAEPATESAADTDAAANADGGGAEPPADAQFEGRPEIDLVELTTSADLVDFASLALDAPSSPAPVDPALDFCRTEFSIDLVVGPALYRGAEVVVGVDLGTDSVFAYDSDCTVVGSAVLP